MVRMQRPLANIDLNYCVNATAEIGVREKRPLEDIIVLVLSGRVVVWHCRILMTGKKYFKKMVIENLMERKTQRLGMLWFIGSMTITRFFILPEFAR